MNKLWSDQAWDDYLYWQSSDKQIADKINSLIKSVEREGLSKGLGKPEPLRRRKAWSRRINHEHRLIYNIDDNGYLWIISCKGHYEE
jgi:toxin YoeB